MRNVAFKRKLKEIQSIWNETVVGQYSNLVETIRQSTAASSFPKELYKKLTEQYKLNIRAFFAKIAQIVPIKDLTNKQKEIVRQMVAEYRQRGAHFANAIDCTLLKSIYQLESRFFSIPTLEDQLNSETIFPEDDPSYYTSALFES